MNRSDPHVSTAATGHARLPWVVAHTYSICAVDPATGEAGVAVASRALAVGGLVPYAQPGAGAIAVQGCVVPEYGVRGLKWLGHGASASVVLGRLTEQDLPVTQEDDATTNTLYRGEGMTVEGEDFLHDRHNKRFIWFGAKMRQVGVVDHRGETAIHNGERLQDQVGSREGRGFTCQGNALANPQIIDAMASAYEAAQKSSTPMDHALMRALNAANEAGGDGRGTRAAALLVVRESGHWTGGDRYRDLRVDDDTQAVEKLAGILSQF